LGADVVITLLAAGQMASGSLPILIDGALRPLIEPKVATVYRVEGGALWCGSLAPEARVKAALPSPPVSDSSLGNQVPNSSPVR
jgi:hypothetical protein